MRLSSSGRYLAFVENDDNGERILDLNTGTIFDPLVKDRLPTNMVYLAGSEILWCPYDDNRFIVHVTTLTDTVGDGKNHIYGQHLFEMSLDGKLFQDVTPKTSAGAAGPGMIYPLVWLVGSTPSADSLLAYFQYVGAPRTTPQVYIPQTRELIPKPDVKGALAQSSSGSQVATIPDATNFDGPLSVNGREIKFVDDPGKIEKASWSPDGLKLALSVLPSYDTVTKLGGYREVWIVDIDRYFRLGLATAPVQVINFQKDFCTYNSWGIWTEFLTNSTIAVTMHGIDADASYIYDITLDGKIVRQLTSMP